MTENISHRISLIKKCVLDKAYSEAMALCTQALESIGDRNDHEAILRERSHVFSCLKDDESAYEDMLQVVNGETVKVEDYYFISQHLLRLGKYKESLPHIDNGILQACDTNDDYYLDSLQFNKLFAYTRLGDRDKAEVQLEHVDSKSKYWIDRPSKPYTKSELEEMIMAA